tara:strand:+ start:256 stop:1035 length:780 start_codon:yes stop_codon:yes gene_type:complete
MIYNLDVRKELYKNMKVVNRIGKGFFNEIADSHPDVYGDITDDKGRRRRRNQKSELTLLLKYSIDNPDDDIPRRLNIFMNFWGIQFTNEITIEEIKSDYDMEEFNRLYIFNDWIGEYLDSNYSNHTGFVEWSELNPCPTEKSDTKSEVKEVVQKPLITDETLIEKANECSMKMMKAERSLHRMEKRLNNYQKFIELPEGSIIKWYYGQNQVDRLIRHGWKTDDIKLYDHVKPGKKRKFIMVGYIGNTDGKKVNVEYLIL